MLFIANEPYLIFGRSQWNGAIHSRVGREPFMTRLSLGSRTLRDPTRQFGSCEPRFTQSSCEPTVVNLNKYQHLFQEINCVYTINYVEYLVEQLCVKLSRDKIYEKKILLLLCFSQFLLRP